MNTKLLTSVFGRAITLLLLLAISLNGMASAVMLPCKTKVETAAASTLATTLKAAASDMGNSMENCPYMAAKMADQVHHKVKSCTYCCSLCFVMAATLNPLSYFNSRVSLGVNPISLHIAFNAIVLAIPDPPPRV